jgi:TetR/AcrR family transcriptional repressor of mexJK operon
MSQKLAANLAAGFAPAIAPATGRHETMSDRKHRAILGAAGTLFVRAGYQGTSMDEIAASAGVSKQTVYKHFADKERLFEAVVLETLDQAGDPFRAEIAALRQAADVVDGLRALAIRYLETVTQPRVLQFRRMVIGEASRLPDLARTYYERAPDRTITALADCFEDLARRGALRLTDPVAAARHYAFLVIGPALDRSLFFGDELGPAGTTPADIDAAIAVFSAAYLPGP